MMKAPVEKRRPTRRQVLRLLAVGGAAGLAMRYGLSRSRSERAVTRSRVLMGTGVTLSVIGDDVEAAEAAADGTLARMADLEDHLSRHRADSELSRLVATGRSASASEALLDVLHLAHRISDLGDGAFDVSVQPVLDEYREAARLGRLPASERIESALERVGYRAIGIDGRNVSLHRPGMRLTLDGIGKGYVVDRGIDELASRGFGNVFVEAGGDLVSAGTKAGGEPWRIGIRNPRPGLSLVARFDATDLAVATSGDYMQPFAADFSQHHILDPRSGYSAPALASATVLATDAATADALATLTMVLGPRKGRELLEELPGCEGYFISKQLEVTRTSGFRIV